MITKGQWREFIKDVERCKRAYGDVWIHNREVEKIVDEEIHMVPEKGPGRWNIVVYKHPGSLDDYKTPRDLYRSVKINSTMSMLLKKKLIPRLGEVDC